jgi:hypothetical protein
VIAPSRPTICSGIVALFDPVENLSEITGAENSPPALASQIVTLIPSPIPISGSADDL